jgi:hypothetical protein
LAVVRDPEKSEGEPTDEKGVISVHANTLFAGIDNAVLENCSTTDEFDSKTLETKSLLSYSKETTQGLMELKRIQSRPPGCSFLGAKAVSIPAKLAQREAQPVSVIIDSGSDITLISERTWKTIQPLPKKLTGRKINLVQVTGAATIQGYVKMPLYFETEMGPVKFEIEAYIVKSMSTPFILGNDFADQYQLSVIREEGNTFVEFGSSGRRIQAMSSTSNPRTDDKGQTFTVKVDMKLLQGFERMKEHRRNKTRRKKDMVRVNDEYVRSLHKVRIPAESSKKIALDPRAFEGRPTIFAERLFTFHGNNDEFFAAPDSLISSKYPYLQISNFSKIPVTIDKGQPVGRLRIPEEFLDSYEGTSPETLSTYYSQALAIQSIAEDMKIKSAHDDFPHVPGDEPLEGGPRQQKVHLMM